MLTYATLKDRPREFLAATGLTHEEFARLLPAFTAETSSTAVTSPSQARAGKVLVRCSRVRYISYPAPNAISTPSSVLNARPATTDMTPMAPNTSTMRSTE